MFIKYLISCVYVRCIHYTHTLKPLSSLALCQGFIFNKMLKKIKNWISIPLAILVAFGIKYLINLFNAPTESWYLTIVIILLLIYFESYDKGSKKS